MALIFHFWSYSIETEFLTEPGGRLVASMLPVLAPHNLCGPAGHFCASLKILIHVCIVANALTH